MTIMLYQNLKLKLKAYKEFSQFFANFPTKLNLKYFLWPKKQLRKQKSFLYHNKVYAYFCNCIGIKI